MNPHDYETHTVLGYDREPPTMAEKVFTTMAMLLLAIGVGTFAWLYVDSEVYVSDDARDGRAAIAPFVAADHDPVARVTRECLQLVGGMRDRADRHFMYGCSGLWFPPRSDESD